MNNPYANERPWLLKQILTELVSTSIIPINRIRSYPKWHNIGKIFITICKKSLSSPAKFKSLINSQRLSEFETNRAVLLTKKKVASEMLTTDEKTSQVDITVIKIVLE